MRINNALFFFCLILLLSCNTKYKTIVSTIGSLPPKKLIGHPENSSSIPISNIDSVLNLNITQKERFELILALDQNLKEKFQVYKTHRTEENFNNVVGRLNQLSIDNDITFDVKIKTSKPGAFVLYRSESNPQEIAAHNPTNSCFINVNIGYYYVWTERFNNKTATPKRYFLSKRDSLTIQERLKK